VNPGRAPDRGLTLQVLLGKLLATCVQAARHVARPEIREGRLEATHVALTPLRGRRQEGSERDAAQDLPPVIVHLVSKANVPREIDFLQEFWLTTPELVR
jgi:hypothetical protein